MTEAWPPHDHPHHARRADRPARTSVRWAARGADRHADRRKPGHLARTALRVPSMAAVTVLVATAIVVTTPAAAAAVAARPSAPATEGDGPPVPADGPPMPGSHPPMPVVSAPSVFSDVGAASDGRPVRPAEPTGPPAEPEGSGKPAGASGPAEPAGSETKEAPSVQKPEKGAGPAQPSEDTDTAGDPGEAALPPMPKSKRLDHEFVTDVLRARDIEWRSTGNCSDREKTTCTSFTDLRWETLAGLLEFQAKSGCRITVTGGTERGHAPGRYSHYNGYKLDIAPSECVDREIEGYDYQGTRGDGAKLYRSPEGGIYARESDHWDITYK